MHMALLNAVDLRLRAAEIVVTGEGAARPSACSRLRAPGRRSTASCFTPRSAEALPPQPSGAGEARRRRVNPQAFVCVGETCSLPVTDPAGLIGAIDAVRHS